MPGGGPGGAPRSPGASEGTGGPGGSGGPPGRGFPALSGGGGGGAAPVSLAIAELEQVQSLLQLLCFFAFQIMDQY